MPLSRQDIKKKKKHPLAGWQNLRDCTEQSGHTSLRIRMGRGDL